MGQVLGLVKVDQSTVGVKEKWGRFVTLVGPGCHCMPWCCGVNFAGVLSLRVQQLDVRCETKTKDHVFVTVVASVQYRAHVETEDAFYKLTNPRGQMKAYAFDVVRACVPFMNLDDLFERKHEIANILTEELEKAMRTYGYEIVQTLIVDIEPDQTVESAMNEIHAAARMRLERLEKAVRGREDLAGEMGRGGS